MSIWFSILFIFHYIFLRLTKQSQFIPVQNVVYFIPLPFLVRKIFTFYLNDVLLFNVHFQGQRVNGPMVRVVLQEFLELKGLSLGLQTETEDNILPPLFTNGNIS